MRELGEGLAVIKLMHTRLFISLKPPRARCQTAARTPRCADARTSPRWQTRRALRIHGREPSARVTEEKPINNTLSHPPARRAPRVCMRGGGGLCIAAPKVHTNEPPHQIARADTAGRSPRTCISAWAARRRRLTHSSSQKCTQTNPASNRQGRHRGKKPGRSAVPTPC